MIKKFMRGEKNMSPVMEQLTSYGVDYEENKKIFVVFTQDKYLLVREIDDNRARIFNDSELKRIASEAEEEDGSVLLVIDTNKMTRARVAAIFNAARRLKIKCIIG